MFDLQKASMLKRASAWLLDVILLSVLATGFALLLSAAFGYDNYNDNLQRYYTEYEQLYGIDFNISDEEYLALGEEDRLRYADAYAKLNDDADVSRAFSIIIQLSLAIMSLSVLLAYMALEFAIPVLWLKNGQTIGKKIFGLAVMRTDSVRVKPIAMLIRTLLGKYTIETMAPLLIIFLILFGSLGTVGLIMLAALALLAQPLRAAEEPKCYLALTFDDGPSGELTERLLEGLAERQVHATFFVCGYRIAEFPDTLSHIAAAGHEIGLHSSNHDYMQKMDYGTALRDLTGCAKAVEDACGVRAQLFRPPGGLYGDTLLRAAKDAGLSVILWSVDPCDWNEAAWDGVLPTVLSEAHDGRIILMHDLSAHSVTCALQAVDRLQAQGYTFCTVSELAALRGTALLPGEVYTGFPPLDS